MKVAAKHPVAQSTVSLKKVQELFTLSNRMSELAEDILEDAGAMKPEFQRELKASLKELEAGKGMKIQSIRDLL